LRTIGREGEGPGEFKGIRALVELPDGGIAVFDSRNLRLTYFTRELELRSDHSLPVRVSRYGPMRLPDGGWALPGRVMDVEHYGSALARVDSVGQLLAYYGWDETETEGNLSGTLLPRVVAYHPRVGLVSMKQFAYFLELWDDDGTLSDVYDPDVDWFNWPPSPSPDPHSILGEPENMFYGIQFDDEGRLWILAQIEGEDWESGLENGRIVDHTKWLDFRIEVLDPESRQTLCATRVTDKRFTGGFPGPGVLQSYSEDRLGRPTLTFWQLSLRVP